MSGLGEEVMTLDGLGDVNNWPGPGWAYCDSCKTYMLHNVTDFPSLTVRDEPALRDGIEGLADLPFDVASKVAGKLRFRPAVGGSGKRRRKNEIELEKAKVGQIRDAAADPNNPNSKRIAKLLSTKRGNLDKLADERLSVAQKARAKAKGSVALVKKLDRVIASSDAKLKQNEKFLSGDKKFAEKKKLDKLNARRAVAAREAVRYAKLDSVAKMMGENASMQADLSQQAAKAVASGDTQQAAAYAEAIRQIGLKSHKIKRIRENQKRLWKIQNKQMSFKRHANRVALLTQELERLRVKGNTSGLSPEEQNKISMLEKSIVAVRGSMNTMTRDMNKQVQTGPVYQREKYPDQEFGPPVGADAARSYDSETVIRKLDDQTFMPPESADFYPEIEKSRTVLNPASFLNATFLAGLTESLPPSSPVPMAPRCIAVIRELGEASDSAIRDNFAVLAGLGINPNAFRRFGR